MEYWNILTFIPPTIKKEGYSCTPMWNTQIFHTCSLRFYIPISHWFWGSCKPAVRFQVLTTPSVARKLSMIEEWCQKQSCLFRWGHYKNKSQNPETLSRFLVPVKMFSVPWKLRKIVQKRKDKSCFSRETTGTKDTTKKIVMNWCPNEDTGFRNNMFYDIKNTYRIVRPSISFRARNVEMKRKNLSKFPTDTADTLLVVNILSLSASYCFTDVDQ
jgi:hypothetical protein